ncbi:MAG: GAF domain-containing protein [Myxococcota bacterium]
MEYTITALNGDSVKIESDNWMTAMGKALAFFDIDISTIGKLTCSPARDGSVFIEDPTGMRSWMIRQHAPDISVRVTQRSPQERWEAIREQVKPLTLLEEEAAVRRPPPKMTMPSDSSLRTRSLSERIVDLERLAQVASREAACEASLELVAEYVHTEASSIAIGTLSDPALRFAAARGPLGPQVIGRQAGFGEGLVGMCFDMRGTLLVNDVASDTPNLDQIDRKLPALAVLCVPLLDDESTAYGVIQLINPPDRQFTRAHVEVVESVARTLAGALASRV